MQNFVRSQKANEASAPTRQDVRTPATCTILTVIVKTACAYYNTKTFARSMPNCERHPKIACILLAMLMICSLAGCQLAPVAAPTVAAEQQVDVPAEPEAAEPAPTAQPILIPMEEIRGDRGGEGYVYRPQRAKLTEKEQAEMRDYMHATYLPSLDASDIPTTFAVICNEDDFAHIDSDMPIWMYTDIPFNMYGGDCDNYVSNRDLVAQRGEYFCGDAARAAMYYVWTQTDFAGAAADATGKWVKDVPAAPFVSYFADDMIAKLRQERVDYYNRHDLIQKSLATSDYSLVYIDGSSRVTARIYLESTTMSCDPSTQRDIGLYDTSIGQWGYNVYDVALTYDADGKIAHAAMQPLTDYFAISSPDRLEYLSGYVE